MSDHEHTNQTNTTMKTKLDEKLEIKADFEILDSHNPANIPAPYQRKTEVASKENKGGIVSAISNFVGSLVSSEPDTLHDFFPDDPREVQKLEAMEQEKIAKGRASMSEEVKRAIRTMPYFYCD